jgi:hypothetical protein
MDEKEKVLMAALAGLVHDVGRVAQIGIIPCYGRRSQWNSG